MVPSASQKRFLTASSADDESPVTKRSKSNQGANADDADDNKENSSGGTTCTDDVVANHGNTDSPDSDIDRNDSSTSALGEASQIEAVTAEQGNGVTEEVHVDTTASSARGRKKSSPRSSMSGVAEAGIIKTIYCENFMCHRKLRVDLNRNVTFIHGQNGSGKSAVLAAIQICFGAKAHNTHRARNLRDLVRRDSTSSAMPSCAKIRVTLLNQGSDAYNHDVYGDTITVERTISLTGKGYSGYKLLDDLGVEKSRSKKDLDDMLDTLNIQVDNPVAVLDQEEAKKFLTGKAEDKYEFFMKATELARVDRSYANTLDTVVELQGINIRRKEGLQSAYEHVEDLKKKWNEHQELGKLETKKLQLGAEFAWAVYNETDQIFTKNVEAKEQVAERISKREEDLRLAEELASTPGEDCANKRKKVDILLEEAQTQAQHKRKLEEELKQAMQPYKQIERELSGILKSQTAASTQLKRAKLSLQDAREQIIANASSAETEEARRTALLKQTEESLSAAQGRVDELKQEMAKWHRAYEEIEPHVLDAKGKVDSLDKRLNGVQHTLTSLQASTGQDILAILGPRVAKVASLVDRYKREKKFRGDVTGPIGCYIKVASGMNEFAAIAEHSLGGNMLDRFVVTNDHDNSLFREIRKQAGCVQDCGMFQVHPSSRYQIPGTLGIEGIERVSSVFVIENDLVFNCLIDNARMEQKAVAQDRIYSQEKLLMKDGGRDSIRGNIKDVYLPRGDYWTVRSGSLAMFSNENALKQTIGVDRSAAIADAQSEELSLRNDLHSVHGEYSKLDNDHSRYQREWNQAKRAMQQNSADINNLTEKIETIKDDMKASVNQTIDTTELEEDVQQAEDLLANHKAMEQKYLADKEELLPNINEAKNRLKECSTRNTKVLEDITAAEQELTQFLETQTQQNDKIEKKRQKLQKYRDDFDTLQRQIDLISSRRADYLRKARTMHFRCQQRQLPMASPDQEEIHPEIQLEPTLEDLEAIEPLNVKHESTWYELRLQKTEERIRNEKERRNVSSEDAAIVYERYSRAKADLAAKTDEVAETDSRIEELEKDVVLRRKRWRQFRKHLARSTGLKFDEMLTMNKYTGNLEFDDVNGTLGLSVQKNTSDSHSESKDVKALSGGERSYTTMALLVALGETLETPFRILDEFDVFLDPETRKLVIKSLIHVAKTLKHRQFIFITPQDLSSISADDQVRILKLHPPDRHHNAGGPSQQTLPFAYQE